MSYTLRGRLETRLVATAVALLGAIALGVALPAWWPVELVALMLGTGLVLDALVYDRVLDYQPGWAALPLGLLELGVLMGLAQALGVGAPVAGAVALYAGAWLVAQLLGHAAFPLLRLSYAEDGGELGRAGQGATAFAVVALAAAGGVAWARQPPTIHLSSGIHQGPLVISHRANVVGDTGAVVRGGIVVTASHVTIDNVTVVGGENGIDVQNAHDVLLDHVTVIGARMDGIHARRSRLTVRDCTINSPAGYTQGIDISFAADMGMSMVEGCTVVGGREGIVVDSSGAMVMSNTVSTTTLRAISLNEMSMGMVEQNTVQGALGVAIFCGDRSMCEVTGNHVSDTRPDLSEGDQARLGFGILAHFGSEVTVRDNTIVRSPAGVGAFSNSTIVRSPD